MLFRTSPSLAQAVALMHAATSPTAAFDECTWFSNFHAWLLPLREYSPMVQRLRHSLMLFGLDQLHDRTQQPFCPDAIPCIALYLNTWLDLTEFELMTPIWEDEQEELKQAYAEYLGTGEPEEVSSQCNNSALSTLNVTYVEPQSNTNDLVFDLLRIILKTLNLGASMGTAYSHLSPLLLQTFKLPGFSLCPIIAHLHALRVCQFERLNAETLDLPGEARTLHGKLAYYALAAMHETSWTPADGIDILDSLVWNMLCLTDSMCIQSPFEWLDTCVHKLRHSGLSVLHGLSLNASSWRPSQPLVYTPAFASLRSYAIVAQQDYGRRYRRAEWFERRHPRLGEAMQTLLTLVPNGVLSPSDWSTLAPHWRIEVQGFPAKYSDEQYALPSTFYDDLP